MPQVGGVPCVIREPANRIELWREHLGAFHVGARDHLARFHDNFREKIVPMRPLEAGEPLAWLMRVTPFRLATDTDYLRVGLARAGLKDAWTDASPSVGRADD
ncbi:MAG: hypothetical protein H7X95_13030 [Deltaproteobacteria bacterium]|nr:hypothetical protein [Deltaproteobacteria bacterium]